MTVQILTEAASNSILELLKSYWHTLNRNYRETIKYLWALAQKHNFVFPSYERIAEMCGYSVRTAKNICARLAKIGLISWKRRGYQSNLYFLPDELLKLDLRNRRLFTDSPRESCTISCTVLNNIDSKKYVHTGEPSASPPATPDVPKNLDKGEQQQPKGYENLPHALKIGFMKQFDFERGGWIIDQLSEGAVSDILNDMKWFAKKQKISSYCGLFVNFALKKIGLKKTK